MVITLLFSRILAMQTPQADQNPSQTSAETMLPSNWLVSLGAAPLLVGLVGSRLITRLILELSESSEEILRGDRLPVLHFPEISNE